MVGILEDNQKPIIESFMVGGTKRENKTTRVHDRFDQ